METCVRVYRPRRPRQSPLHRLVAQHLEEFLRVYDQRFAPCHGPLRPVVERVMDKLEVGNADVMGYHTGSKTSVELARQQPERIKHLVLVSAPVYTEEDLAKQNADMGHPDELQEDGSHLLKTWAGLWRWRGPEQTPADIMRALPDHIKGGDKKHWAHAAAFSYVYPPTIPHVTAPILVLNTNDDLVVYTRRIRAYLTNGKVLELPDWGHGFLDYHTEETAAFVRPFLDDDVWPEGAA